MKRIFLLLVAATLFELISSFIAEAQNYPDRLIKIVVPYPPGGPADVSARLVAAPLSSNLGQTVVIENQSGAGGRTGAKAVALASPDGYTLQLGGTNPNAMAKSLYRNLDFDPIRDLAAVALIAVDSNVLVINPNVPAKTLQELVHYAKANCTRDRRFTGWSDSDRHEFKSGAPSAHQGRTAASDGRDQRSAMARASRRADNGAKRNYRNAGLRLVRFARSSENPGTDRR
jgi:tripartite-type tricarboxylate transporter receptor subunit TctC